MTKELNEQQQKAIDTILNIVATEPTNHWIGLYGAGGVGKSHTIHQLVKQAKNLSVVVTATTGKAASIIGGVTIHSYFGMKMELNQQAELEEEAMRLGRPSNDVVADILVIDEASMLDRQTVLAIQRMEKRFKAIVLVGDPLQLPPVKSERPNLYGLPHIILTEQHRMKHSGMHRLAEDMRQLLDNELTSIDLADYVDGKSVHLIDEIPQMKPNQSALAYHNVTVEKYIPTEHGNNYNLFSSVVTTMLKDNKFIQDVVYPNGADVELELDICRLGVTRKGDNYTLMVKDGMYLLPKIDNLLNQYLAFDGVNYFIVHKGLKKELTDYREAKFNLAKSFKDRLVNKYGAINKLFQWKQQLNHEEVKEWNKLWSSYSRATTVVHIRPTESRTLHKAQGSTLTDVYVDLDDVQEARGGHLNALYVAFTRATDSLYIKGKDLKIWAE